MIAEQIDERPPVVPPTVMTVSPVDEAAQYASAAAAAFSDAPAEPVLDVLSSHLMREFSQAEQLRRDTEERWLKDLRQYRGVYEPEVEAKLVNRSRAFVKRTRVKVKTTDSRIMDLLFPAGSEKNWSCDNTPVPSVSDETRAAVRQQLQQANQPASDKDVDEAVLTLVKEAAKGMSQVIEDQLVETRYKDTCRKAVHSGNLYGTGVIKGPLVERKVRTRYVQTGEKWASKDETYIVPFVEHVPLWRFYPDMTVTELEDCRFVYERHSMSKHQMVALSKRKSFKGEIIKKHLVAYRDGCTKPRYYDNELRSLGERDAADASKSGQYEVLERWGWIDGYMLKQAGVRIPDERLHETFFSNIWMLCTGEVIKAVLQPINGVTWPFHMYQFDKDETSIFADGLAAIMRDDQDMLNASVRMMLDNGALTAGPLIEVALGMLATTEHADVITPWKVFFRKEEHMDTPAVRAIELPNGLEWLSKMAEFFDKSADDNTAIPRYMSGENATSGAAGTSSGLSMLMGAVNIVIKDLITSWDEGVTRGFIQSLYRWNMQFHKDNKIKGDFDVRARGTASLIAKEVRSQQLENFSQLAANPMDAPFIKRHKLLQQRAEALELSDVVKTEDEVRAESETEEGKRNQELQRKMQEAQVGEQIAKAQKLSAEAQVAKTRVDEMLANIEKIVADTVATKVETIFAALQAGGAATRDPVTAPAGDEVLQSAGYKDMTPTPPIAALNRPPVQEDFGTQRLMNRGQSFTQEPRGGQPGGEPDLDEGGTVAPMRPQLPRPGPVSGAQEMPDANTGQRAGIETARFE